MLNAVLQAARRNVLQQLKNQLNQRLNCLWLKWRKRMHFVIDNLHFL